MLKKIPTEALRLGMHLHALEGSWIQHPFWRARFTLADVTDLQRLRECGVAACWIDVERGVDVEPEACPQAVAESHPEADPPAAAPNSAAPVTSLTAELNEAAAICRRSRDAVAHMFAEARLGRAIDTAGCRTVVEEVTASVQRNAGALVSLARLKTRDDYTYMHSVAVCALMVALARQLGMSEALCYEAGLAGLMHDVGKAVMPPEVLGKPGKLTDDEWCIMRSHPERGYRLLADGGGTSAAAMDVALHHHERFDGTGYPHRLAADAITEFARMGAICDVYDAITSHRPYKAGWDPAESIARMASWKGHFDPKLFNAFVQSLGIYPTGAVVRLESGKLAVVAEQNPGALLAPLVVAFFSTKSQMHIPPQRIDLSRPNCHERIVAREPEAAAQFRHVDELWAAPEVLKRLPRNT